MRVLRDCAAFVFDMDGLLLDTERLSSAALHAAAADLGLTLPSDIFLEMIGRRGPDIHRRLAVRVGAQDTADRLIAGAEVHYSALLARGIPVKEGAVELLAWLESHGRPCAVATSTRTPRAEQKLAAAGLRPFFRAVIGGDQVEHGKPAPDVYLRAAAALGVAPPECGVFEDSEPGLRAAHAAGTRVVWIPDLAPVSPAAQALALARADSLSEVLAAFLNEPA
ncbi:MAG: HAD family phosphatase [Opitutales bacterium]|jgi:HAD superfamily hydrolase (TIGR01509 family)